MHIIVKAAALQQQTFLAKGVPANVRVEFMEGDYFAADADAYFDLCYEEDGATFASITKQPVFINAVIDTCDRLPGNAVRINAWNGFLERGLVEIALAHPSHTLQMAGADSQMMGVKNVMAALDWKFQIVADVPGMIAARVIAMIINEAYFGLGDDISTKKDIDTAMKLGTNYPYGPFEWSEKIGLKKIGVLLQTLSQTDSRYLIAPALQQEIE